MPRPLLRRPEGARAIYVLAHGAGAGSRHEFLGGMATALAARAVATYRWDLPAITRAAAVPSVRDAVARAAETGLPVIAGGKSFGGRMASHAQAEGLLPDARGLAFLGFPLHPPDKPGIERAAHLGDVKVPMLFLQGTRDALARMDLVEKVLRDLPGATLVTFDGADHGFRGVTHEALAEAFVNWLAKVTAPRRSRAGASSGAR